jgi:hypothetical protein
MSKTKKGAPTRKRARALDTPTVPAKRDVAKVKPEAKKPEAETLAVPAALFLAAESIAAKADAEKHHLRSLLLHQKDPGTGRIVGTDGTRLFVGSFPIPGKVPSWMKAGLMLGVDELKPRISMIGKVNSLVTVSHTQGGAVAMLSDPDGRMVFRMPCGDVQTFPGYEAAFKLGSFSDMTEEGDAKAKVEWQPVGFNSRHLKHCGDIAKILEAAMPKETREKDGMTIRVFDSGEVTAPRVFDFIGFPGAVLVIAGMQLAQQALPLATARILAPAVKLTLAALRAHETRNMEWAAAATDEATKAAFIAKAGGFAKRIADILAQVVPDLPQIAGPKPDEAPKVVVGTDKPDTIPPAPVTPAEKAAATTKANVAKRKAASTVH